MNHKKTAGIYFIIIWMLVLIYLSFISFYIVLVGGMIDGINIIDNNPAVVSVEVAGSEVMPILEGDSSTLSPPFGKGLEKVEMAEWQTRNISAYNAGDITQCSGNPCISASGDNICELLNRGINVCAANWVSLGTKIEVEGLGKCIVLDRTAKKFSHCVDWAMKKDEKQRALEFGRRNLRVWVIN